MEPSYNSHLSSQFNDPEDSPEGQALLTYKAQLEAMKDMFLHGLDFRRITEKHIDKWETLLRDIIAGSRVL